MFWISFLIALTMMVSLTETHAGESTDPIREEVTSLHKDLESLQSHRYTLERERDTLSSEVHDLKTPGSTYLFRDFRLKRKLRALRDLLITIAENEKMEVQAASQLTAKQQELQQDIRDEILLSLEQSDSYYRDGRIQEAVNRYEDTARLLQEHRSLSESLGNLPPGNESSHVMDIKELRMDTPAQLREISDLLGYHSETVDRELRVLESLRQDLTKKISIRRDLLRFQGVNERTLPAKEGEDADGVEKQIRETEQQIAGLDHRYQDLRKFRKTLATRIKDLDAEAERIDKSFRRKKR